MRRSLRSVLDQSILGHHHLFEPGVVRLAMSRPGEDLAWLLAAGVATETEGLLDELDGAEDLGVQRDLVAQAPLPVQETLVQLYFDVLFRYMERRGPSLH